MTIAAPLRSGPAAFNREAGTARPRAASHVPVRLAVSCLAAALLLWLSSLTQIDPSGLGDLGIVSILPWTLWAALVLLAIGFMSSMDQRLANGPLPFLFLAMLVLVLHATPAISYDTLRYSWAWKHIGIVDYIQRHGGLDPVAPYLAAYHNWPGFFLASTWAANLAGAGPLEVANAARFTPTALNLLYLCALFPILRRFTDDNRLVWTAAWVFLAGNWVGQDYFSPQGAAFLLYLLAIGLCVGPIAAGPRPPAPRGRSIARLVQRLRAECSRGLPEESWGRSGRMASAVAVLVIVFALAASHQLTPIVLVFALAGLALIGRLSPGYSIFTAGVTAWWALYAAAPFVAAYLPSQLATFGQVITHASDNLIDTTLVSPGQVWIALASRALTATVAVAALLGGVRRLYHGHRDGPAIALALAPLPLLVVTPYGGEIVFRIYLLALPFLAFFAGALFFPVKSSGLSAAKKCLAGGFVLLLAVGFLLANNGKDRQYRFSADEVAAAKWLYERAPPGSLLVEGSRNYPAQFMNYEKFVYVPIARQSPESRVAILKDPVDVLARWLSDGKWSAGFVIITRSQKALVDALRTMPAGSLDQIEKALLESPRFKLVHATADAKIFALHPVTGPMGDWVR